MIALLKISFLLLSLLPIHLNESTLALPDSPSDTHSVQGGGWGWDDSQLLRSAQYSAGTKAGLAWQKSIVDLGCCLVFGGWKNRAKE